MGKQSIRHGQTKWNKTRNWELRLNRRTVKISPAAPGQKTHRAYETKKSAFIWKWYRLYLYCIVLHCSPAFPLWGPSPVTPPGRAVTQTNAPEEGEKRLFLVLFFVEMGQDLGVAKVCHGVHFNLMLKSQWNGSWSIFSSVTYFRVTRQMWAGFNAKRV